MSGSATLAQFSLVQSSPMDKTGAKTLPLVIVNPASRGGAGARDWAQAASTLSAHFGPFERRFTEAPGHATELAREEVESGRRALRRMILMLVQWKKSYPNDGKNGHLNRSF